MSNTKQPYLPDIRDHRDGRWKWHFRMQTCYHEVISYLDLLAGRDPRRFCFPSPDDIRAHTEDWKKPRDWCRKCKTREHSGKSCEVCSKPIYHRPYEKSAVEKSIGLLKDYGVIFAATFPINGRREDGYVVIDHDHACGPQADRCIWIGDILEDQTYVPFYPGCPFGPLMMGVIPTKKR